MNVVLVGFMASGKTSVGRRVAKRLGYRFMDTDQFIEAEQGCTINDIFGYQGEAYFRELESQLLERLKRCDSYVFSTGGGILTTPGNLERLREIGVLVFLKADTEDIITRLSNDTRRPNARAEDPEALRARVLGLLEVRMPLYEQADIVIETLGKTPNQVAGEVIRRVAGFRRKGGSPPEPSAASEEPDTTTPPEAKPAS